MSNELKTKSENFLFFISGEKVLALKITTDWNNCQAFIYDLADGKITKYENKDYPSNERAFFSHFMAMPINGKYKAVVVENSREFYKWKLISQKTGLMFCKLVEELEESGNDADICPKWKSFVENLVSTIE